MFKAAVQVHSHFTCNVLLYTTESASAAAISITLIDALCSEKWYDMPHVGCGIHSLQ